MAVAAACFRERTARVLAGYRRTASDRGRGQARPFGVSDLAAVLATCHRPRRRGRGVESDQVALERSSIEAGINTIGRGTHDGRLRRDGDRRRAGRTAQHLPNALTVLRIAAVPALAWLATCGTAMFFVAVLIACLIGDVVANSG